MCEQGPLKSIASKECIYFLHLKAGHAQAYSDVGLDESIKQSEVDVLTKEKKGELLVKLVPFKTPDLISRELASINRRLSEAGFASIQEAIDSTSDFDVKQSLQNVLDVEASIAKTTVIADSLEALNG